MSPEQTLLDLRQCLDPCRRRKQSGRAFQHAQFVRSDTEARAVAYEGQGFH
jgi:hypothetical protein